jgi:hypothetical protein
MRGINNYMKNQDPKELSRTKLRYLFRRVLKKIEEKPVGYFSFKKMKGLCGVCEWEEGIKIDPRREIIPTIIHEVLHDMYPENWEGWTLRVESKIMGVLKSKDYITLIILFCRKVEID